MTGMAAARLAVALLLPLLLLAPGCAARDLLVGGRGGWTAHPAEPLNRWAERNRFQVNDTLVFRYKEKEDSVLVVSRAHYDACNTTAPYLRLEGGDNAFVLANSGPYFFISGQPGRCHAAERLIVIVLAVRSPPSTPRESPKSPSASPPPVPAAANSTKSPPPALAPPPHAGNSSTSPPPAHSSPPPAHAPPPARNSSTSPPPAHASPPPAHAPPPAGNSSTSPPPAPAPPAAGNSSTSPPPALAPPAAGNSSTSPPPALAPPPVANATVAPAPGSPSSASALRGSFLACLVVAGAIVLA